MTDALFKALAAGLSIWEHKEKHKYQDKFISLKKEWYEEYDKGPDLRDHSVLDRTQRELCILADSFAAAVGAKNAVD